MEDGSDGMFHMNRSHGRIPGTLISHKQNHQVVAFPLELREAGLFPQAMGTINQVNMGENEVLQVGQSGHGF